MIRPDIRALAAYAVPDATGMVKLDAMENPFALPEALRLEWAEHLAQVEINRYPDAAMNALRERIAARDGVLPEQILLGNGSDEIIQMLLLAADTGTCVVPQPTFVMYELIARWLKRPTATVPLEADFSLDADKLLRVSAREKAAIVFLACPNNPTGNLWPRESLAQIAANSPGIIVFDEAYQAFCGQTHLDLIAPNVLVLRTFSKLGWAGLRLGYAIGDEDTIKQVNKVRLPYNINSLTQASALFFLDHYDEFARQTQQICSERERLYTALAKLPAIEAFPSQTNFLLVRVNDADAVHQALMHRGILIKNLSATGGLLSGCLRVTIGTREENDSLLTALKEILS